MLFRICFTHVRTQVTRRSMQLLIFYLAQTTKMSKIVEEFSCFSDIVVVSKAPKEIGVKKACDEESGDSNDISAD